MRIGKCLKCKGELYVSEMNWSGWKIKKCKVCGYEQEEKSNRIIVDKGNEKHLIV